MYAIIEAGGRQYKVQPGQTVLVDKMDSEPGTVVDLTRVLMVSADGDVKVGRPLIEGARVVAEVVGHEKGDKIIVLKFKPKVRYRRKKGHRQQYTRLLVREIQGVS